MKKREPDFSTMPSGRTRGKRHGTGITGTHEIPFKYKKKVTVRVVKHLQLLPGKVVVSPSSEILRPLLFKSNIPDCRCSR